MTPSARQGVLHVIEQCPHCLEDLVYAGGGNWECPKCGWDTYLGVDEDGEDVSEALSDDEMGWLMRTRGEDW